MSRMMRRGRTQWIMIELDRPEHSMPTGVQGKNGAVERREGEGENMKPESPITRCRRWSRGGGQSGDHRHPRV